MRPKTTKADVPTTHDVMSHLHNEFVGWLQEMKADIEEFRVNHLEDIITYPSYFSGCSGFNFDDSGWLVSRYNKGLISRCNRPLD
jgi:hypothetical protein